MRSSLQHAWIALVVACVSASAAAGSADDLSKGLELAAAGRCEEALPLLAEEQSPGSDPRIDRIRVQCLLRTKRYAEAATLAEALSTSSPADPQLSLYLGIARFHTGDLDGAREALESADPERAETHLYRGLLLLQLGEARTAAAALDQATALDSEKVGPIASYYAAHAWARAGERDRAADRLEDVRKSSPGSVWARQAEDDSSAYPPVPGSGRWWLKLTGGFEWDDNVTLRPNDPTLVANSSGQRDVRGSWRFDSGAVFWSDGFWSAGIGASFNGNAHHDLDDFDLLYPKGSLWLERRLSPVTRARLRYDFGYAWVDEEPLLRHNTVTGSLTHVWGGAGTSEVFGSAYHYDYLARSQDVDDGTGAPGSSCPPDVVVCGPPGINEKDRLDRDGPGFVAGAAHVWPLPWVPGHLRAAYAYQRFFAQGRDSRYQSHTASAALRILLPLQFVFDGGSSFTYRPFEDRSTLPDLRSVTAGQQYWTLGIHRRDRVWQVHLSLERDLGESVNLEFRYHYRHNRSNVESLDYDRNILGVYLTFALGR
ncbi:MAG: tetratricopeptide repeat protein [Myxococcota bacterium]